MPAAAPKTQESPLTRSVTTLLGVGPERAGQLARLGITTVEEFLLHRPSRYEDRKKLCTIAQLELKEPAITHGKVIALGTKWFRRRSKSVTEMILEDGTGRLYCHWWNLPYMEKYFAMGDDVLVFGKPVSLKPRTIDHPETEVLEGGSENFIHLNRLTPIYPLTEGLPQRWLRGLMWRTLQAFETRITEPHPGVAEYLSAGASNGAAKVDQCPGRFTSRAQAIHMLHFPEKEEEPEIARRRLALDELLDLQLEIQTRRKNLETKAKAWPCAGDNHLIKPFLGRLGFKLTEAQTKVLRELRKDMAGPHPMRRLLQGDVGSGKTVVAACCSLMALESGFNVALMAPTEILAEQHFLTFSKWLRPLGLNVELQTGTYKTRRAKAEGRNGTAELATGLSTETPAASFTIGTHALIEPGFTPERLGLVIIDEQHRFGVSQREQLVRKGQYPHLLVMTATPIPRTLGLTLYGDLDVSTIDRLPPGRGRLKTFVRGPDKLPLVWEFVCARLAEGRQAYVVCPRIDESGPEGIKAVTTEFQRLQQLFPQNKVVLLHGRLPAREKEQVMAAFRSKAAQILLATSIIEVGVDVPNATVMVVENAEQFGLAQLHQLRGRIGRGAEDSYCVLVAAALGKESRQRLQVLATSSDGFEIAEADLRLRGPGELLGREQSGSPRFRFADLSGDLSLIHQARELAGKLLENKLS
jgi:ATP-dependent DNA helicase RecG